MLVHKYFLPQADNHTTPTQELKVHTATVRIPFTSTAHNHGIIYAPQTKKL
jgi:hypothetical protein